jgi:hypothetical protein
VSLPSIRLDAIDLIASGAGCDWVAGKITHKNKPTDPKVGLTPK